ncbi:hypothetical protein LMG27174_04693 [Paraburkholderia rhynchosiae]|uniref:Uncharacterized protein n=1 Tax=Paraburkholderia rhynchosiae TaxID=487049 RepID=A0A6J5BWG1_9BURK|nr:hypothetical protein LMG27174_04693 [Paraburkholderia rhynchosiae]
MVSREASAGPRYASPRPRKFTLQNACGKAGAKGAGLAEPAVVKRPRPARGDQRPELSTTLKRERFCARITD